ncbi:exocyst complex component 1-like [Astyanax mexicanus]|uniref:Exocyst complex component 1 like n=2 Tax=Astyanax mexicanus TaxID=7994 RepID=A0A3B1JD47_ASTMX|nr:exocyst complex component 1-like [Astyanax mexicanus]KAG9260058.1 exocyst complex component 1-like [Astyanax mexicanus]
MSSLLKEEMQRVLFGPEEHRLVEFIEIEEKKRGRHFLCVSVSKGKEVQITVVRCRKSQKSGYKKAQRIGLEDSYVKTEVWALQELRVLDGRDPDIDDPCFLMHFDTVRPVKAVNCAAKYSLARCLLALSETHQHSELRIHNFDWTYVQPTSIYSSRGDCMVLMRICFYAFNLVCLTLCPVPV